MNLIEMNGVSVKEFDDEYLNATIKIDQHGRHYYYCHVCGRSVDDMRFLSETGYYIRIDTYKCPCGQIVKSRG